MGQCRSKRLSHGRESDFLALTHGDETDVTHLPDLPPVKYSPGLEYDLRFPRFVKDADRAPRIDDLVGAYDVLISAPGGSRYRQYLTTSSEDEESILVSREDDGRVKFQLVCRRTEGEEEFHRGGWTCFGDARIEYRDWREAQCMEIGSSSDPFPENYMGERYGTVAFCDRRGATFYASPRKDSNRMSRCQQQPQSTSQAEKELVNFAAANENHWIHRRFSLPMEVVAEVREFLGAPMPPPVFFFERGDLWLDTYGNDDSWADVIYVARKRKTPSIGRFD